MKYIMTLVSLFSIDNAVKDYIEANVEQGMQKPVFGGRLFIKKHHNTGAMLHLGAKNTAVVTTISLLFTILMTGVFAVTLTTKGNVLLKSGLALLLGGAYSNTYDRLQRQYVVDYVSFQLSPTGGKGIKKLKKALESVVFNLSDFGIIIGAMLIVISQMIKAS